MINPYIFPSQPEGKEFGLIAGYVVAVKDKGDSNMLLFKKDTMDQSSNLVAVAAWGLKEGQSGSDMRKMTADLKGRFVVCYVLARKKIKDGKVYTNYDLKYIIKAPIGNNA